MRNLALAFCVFGGSLICRGQSTEPPVPDTATIEQSVEETRNLLDGGLVRPMRPWYDQETDGIRRLDLRIEPERRSWNFSWPTWTGSFIKGLGWVGIVLLSLLLALIVWRIFAYWRSGRDQADNALAVDEDADRVDRVEALPFRVARQAADLLGEARRQYELGNFDEAIVYFFSHQLVELDKQHLIHLVRGKTNRQLVRELLRQRELRLLVEQTMVAFEDVFFGGHALGRARFEACWFELERFKRLLQEAVR